jgi:hypothetical protein
LNSPHPSLHEDITFPSYSPSYTIFYTLFPLPWYQSQAEPNSYRKRKEQGEKGKLIMSSYWRSRNAQWDRGQGLEERERNSINVRWINMKIHAPVDGTLCSY